MTNQEITQSIADAAQETLGVTLTENESLREAGVDSLSLVELIAAVEDRFGITFDDDDLQPANLRRLSDVAAITGKYV